MKRIVAIALCLVGLTIEGQCNTGDEKKSEVTSKYKNYNHNTKMLNMHYVRYQSYLNMPDINRANMSRAKKKKLGNTLLYAGIGATAVGALMMSNASSYQYNNTNGHEEGDLGGAVGALLLGHGIAGIIVGGIIKSKAK